MPFVLEPSAPIGRSLRRVTRQRLRAAIDLLDELDHDDSGPGRTGRARRTQALQGSAGRGPARAPGTRRRLHDVQRDRARRGPPSLAPIRDAHVMTGTLGRLRRGRARPRRALCVSVVRSDLRADRRHAGVAEGGTTRGEGVESRRRLRRRPRRIGRHLSTRPQGPAPGPERLRRTRPSTGGGLR